jgi:hypothetical protein
MVTQRPRYGAFLDRGKNFLVGKFENYLKLLNYLKTKLGAKVVYFTKNAPPLKINPILVRQNSRLKGNFFT